MEPEQKVKIVGTLGPASSDPEIIRQLIEAGLDAARLNFSHGTHEGHRRVFEIVRAEADRLGHPVAVIANLSGPKIRVGEMHGGAVSLVAGASLEVTTDDVVGTAERFSTTYDALASDVGPGDRLLLDDGLLSFLVEKVEGTNVGCSVVVGGVLKDHKGMNIPGTPLSTPALTAKDRKDLAFAVGLGVDYLALSFVRRPEDVLQAKELAGNVPVIAKIEKPEAIENLQQIIEVADGIMVARGDLGVEAGAEKVPLLQKRIIAEAAVRGRPVIVATQMLDSMIHNPRPTRAEVSDVANAVLDGTDAVMLSGETATGSFPVKAVAEMSAIIAEVEHSAIFGHLPRPAPVEELSFSNAVARAAVTTSVDMGLKALAVYSETGHSAALVSACRPNAAIVAFSRHSHVLRRLALRWGVTPLHGDWVEGVGGVVKQAETRLLELGLVRPGDDIAVTFGAREMSGPGHTDTLKLWRIRGSS